MPKYILHYFDIGARGEASRMMFKLAGVDFEDRRYTFGDWAQAKSKFPLKQIPVLELDGGIYIQQSKAILRYLANEFGKHGSTNLEGALLDTVIDTVEDAWWPINIMAAARGEERTKLLTKYTKEQLPSMYTRLEALYAQYKCETFFLGNSITSADLFFFTLVETVDFFFQMDSLKDFPKLSALKSRIAANPVLAKWITERPTGVPNPFTAEFAKMRAQMQTSEQE